MTPGARVHAAIDLIDAIAAGQPAEQALTRWARASRFAGSKDRAAVRDHVFDVLRMWRSTAVRGGGESGRARLIGLLRTQDVDLNDIFTGQGHAPAPLTPEEAAAGATPDGMDARDLPDWLWPLLCEGVSPEQAEADAELLRHRASVDLRVNLLKGDRAAAQATLHAEGIETEVLDQTETALRVVTGARKVAGSQPYRDGLVELQDVASQSVVGHLPLSPGMRVLDYCAGGGGKALAIAAQVQGEVWAHDGDPRRMRDLPDRARRAGASITPVETPPTGFDLVLCDVPCSGSGSWRRAPEAKWRMTPERLDHLVETQATILDEAAACVAPGGILAYATCSLLHHENTEQVARFCDMRDDFALSSHRAFRLTDGGDGFFVAVLTKDATPA